jgi:hypothetical protein
MSILYKKSVRGPARVSVGLLRSGALAVETHEDWLEPNRHINMKLLKEHKRELIKEAA